jgi:GxxExxY protein
MDLNECTGQVIGAAIEVHRVLGPGLLESAYRQALQYEIRLRGLKVVAESLVSIGYKEVEIPDAFRIDLLVENAVIVEIKAVEKILPVHRAQLLTYLRCANKKIGLLMNFHETTMKHGIVRVANQF